MALSNARVLRIAEAINTAYSQRHINCNWTLEHIVQAIKDIDGFIDLNGILINNSFSQPFKANAGADDKGFVLASTILGQRIIVQSDYLNLLQDILNNMRNL